MSLRTQLSVGQEQRLALLPKMLQSIEVLQLATFDLLRLIDRELEANETLEVVRAETLGSGAESADSAEFDGCRSRCQDDSGLQSAMPQPAPRGDDIDAKTAMLHSVAAPGHDLVDHVREQVAWLALGDQVAMAVVRLAESLDESGYLQSIDSDLRQEVGDQVVDQAVGVLRSLEPLGLGAAGPIDAMLLQVPASDPDRPLLEDILHRHLEALARHRESEVARALGLRLDDLERLKDRLSELDPRPCAVFHSEPTEVLRPDLIVERVDGELHVRVEDQSLPLLGINSDYASLADSSDDSSLRSYLRQKLRSAKDLITAVEARKSTLVRVGLSVLSRQPEFLERGRVGIRPLKMADVAEELGLHPSTISRAIAGKAVQTDRGVFSLRDFFDGGRSGSAAAARAGSPQGFGKVALHEQLSAIVAAEDPQQPLTDEQLVEQLSRGGAPIARRTVAKYRRELGIPSVWRRRQRDRPGRR